MPDFSPDFKCPRCGVRMWATGGVIGDGISTMECPTGHYKGLHTPRPVAPLVFLEFPNRTAPPDVVTVCEFIFAFIVGFAFAMFLTHL